MKIIESRLTFQIGVIFKVCPVLPSSGIVQLKYTFSGCILKTVCSVNKSVLHFSVAKLDFTTFFCKYKETSYSLKFRNIF